MWIGIRRVLAIASLLPGALAFAQNTNSGDIRGTVTDPTGAVIPDVTITVKDIDKGVTNTYTSDGAGLFDTGPIVPDHYLLTFTKDGFQTLVRGPITLDVGIDTINAQMTVGSTSERVEVKTDVALLTTETGAQESTLSSETMTQLPQVNADWQNFVILLPGASGVAQGSSDVLNPGQRASINGNLPYNSMLADGATTTLPMSQNSDVTVFETTSEVKVSSSAFSAQYGIGGIIFNQITKGGSNKWHGVGYEYFQNNALNAAPYAFGAKASVPILHYNNFGGSVSGPIWKNKLFFYFNADKTINNGGASNGFVSVPTDAMKNGDFSGMPTIYDPTTQTIQSTGTMTLPDGTMVKCPCAIRKSFAEEYGNGNRIPASMIDPVAKAIQAYYPSPNTAATVNNGIPQKNFFYNTPSSNPFMKYFGRLDFDVTSNNRLTISETNSDNPATYLNQGICPINCQTGDVSRDNAQISDVWTFSPNTINEARFGFTDQLNFFVPYSLGQGLPQKLGWQFAKADTFPAVNVDKFYEGSYFGPNINAVYKEFVYDMSDVVTMIRGRHVLHFGGEFLINQANSTAWGNINAGTMAFNGNYTSQAGSASAALSGIGYADFLLGQTQSWSAQVTPEYGARWKSPQLFIQDDFKLRPNLTVNLGLRYEIETGWSEVKGNMAVFDPAVPNPATGTNGAMWYGFSHAHGRTSLQAPLYNIVLPRVGFAWQPASNMTLRGGFGIYANSWSEDTYGSGMGNAFGNRGDTQDITNGICPIVKLSGTGASADTTNPECGVGTFNSASINSLYLNSPTTPEAFNGQNVSYNQYHTPIPENYQWTVAVERQFGPDLMASIAYVGNHGKNLNFPVNINQVPVDKLGPDDATGATNARPYKQYQQIKGSTNNAISNYNALQASVQKRMTYGLELSVNYTWSHFLDEQSSSGWGDRGGTQRYQNAYDPRANYGNSNFDVRNMFKGQVIYQLPLGRGRQFLNNNAFLDAAVGGWQTSATFIAQGGNPFTLTTGNNNTSFNQSGENTQYPNLIGNPLNVPGGRSVNSWYNVNAFAVPAAGTYGNFRRNQLFGPGLTNINFSLGKSFTLWPDRGVTFQIRADTTNIFNHPSFKQPDTTIGPGGDAKITGVTVGGRSMQLYGRLSF
jgi:Carboxypeptidase regulatory-like domain